MLAPQITNHISLALGRLMFQYKQVANNYTYTPLSGGAAIPSSAFDVLLNGFVDELQLLENAIYSLDAGRQLFNGTTTPAVGAQLDLIGQTIGLARNGLTDSQYITFIFGQIAEDNSNASAPLVGSIIALLFGVSTFIFQPLYPAEVFFEIPSTTTLPQSQYLAATYLIAGALGAGISLSFAATYPAASAFQFTSVGGPQVGGGFGDKNNSATGGGFASLIFSNNLSGS